jgi:predicted DNA-binding transcriptional regulator YafY
LRQRVAIDYVRADEQHSARTIEPLGLIFLGQGVDVGCLVPIAQ